MMTKVTRKAYRSESHERGYDKPTVCIASWGVVNPTRIPLRLAQILQITAMPNECVESPLATQSEWDSRTYASIDRKSRATESSTGNVLEMRESVNLGSEIETNPVFFADHPIISPVF
jgi:uncharacterized Rmd1/YagE family protein